MPRRACARSARSITVSDDLRRSRWSRRELLGAALALPLLRARPPTGRAPAAQDKIVASARGFVVGSANADLSAVTLTRDWIGEICRSRVTNRGAQPVAVKEVVLFDVTLDLPPATALYGESFQMLSQTGGTLGAPRDL